MVFCSSLKILRHLAQKSIVSYKIELDNVFWSLIIMGGTLDILDIF